VRFGLRAVRFDSSVFSEIKMDKDAMLTVFVLIIIVGLVVGVSAGLFTMVWNLLQPPSEQAMQYLQEARSSVESFAAQMPEEARDIAEWALQMGEDIVRVVPTSPFEVVFRGVGTFLTTPFQFLFWWIVYGAVVQGISKIFGSKTPFSQLLSCTGLAVAPRVLGFFDFIPYIGGLIGLAGLLWSIPLYVMGVRSAYDSRWLRAILLALSPLILLLIVAILLVIITVLVIIVVSSISRAS
jgi:hypothetical protein